MEGCKTCIVVKELWIAAAHLHLAGRRRMLKAVKKNEARRVTARLGNVWTLSLDLSGSLWPQSLVCHLQSVSIGRLEIKLHRPLSFLGPSSLSVSASDPPHYRSADISFIKISQPSEARLFVSSLFCKMEENRGLVVTLIISRQPEGTAAQYWPANN